MLAGANAYVSWYMIGVGAFCGDGRELDQYPYNTWGNPYMSRCMAMAHFSKHITGANRLVTSPDIPADGADFEYSAYVKGDSLIVIMVNLNTKSNTAKLELPYKVHSCKCIQSTDGNLYVESNESIETPKSSFNLVVPAKSITTYIYQMDKEAMAMGSVTTNNHESVVNNAYYSLDGVRNESPMGGINIHMGKKVFYR
jgi:glucuronoarabinoxylan endo-1,4-beta-xylanase